MPSDADRQLPPELGAQRFSRRALVRTLIGAGVLGAGAIATILERTGRPALRMEPAQPESPRGSLGELRSIVAAAQMLILPSEPDSPGAVELGAIDYLEAALVDPRVDEDDVDAVKSIGAWLKEQARVRFDGDFPTLSNATQNELLRALARDEDAREWLGVLTVFTLEAALSDPVYGGNRDGAGWRWLRLTPAEPRPQAPWHVALKDKAP